MDIIVASVGCVHVCAFFVFCFLCVLSVRSWWYEELMIWKISVNEKIVSKHLKRLLARRTTVALSRQTSSSHKSCVLQRTMRYFCFERKRCNKNNQLSRSNKFCSADLSLPFCRTWVGTRLFEALLLSPWFRRTRHRNMPESSVGYNQGCNRCLGLAPTTAHSYLP